MTAAGATPTERPERKPVGIPILGSINEPRLEAEGWRVVRDAVTGLALYLEHDRPRRKAASS